MSSNTSKNRLMLVDNPKLLFKTLKTFANKLFIIDDFHKELEKNIGKKIHIKTTHTYFYSSSIYKIIIKTGRTEIKPLYRLSNIGLHIISIYDDIIKIEEYQNTIKTLIIYNKIKGELFNDFLKYIELPKSEEEIYKKYKAPTGKTLIAWCLEANIIIKIKHVIGLNKKRNNKVTTLNEFWPSLKNIYEDMQKTDFLELKKIYVDIDEIKLRIMCDLDINDEQFDNLLENLLNSEFAKYITLDGGPPLVYKGQYEFRYKGKNYLYLSLRH